MNQVKLSTVLAVGPAAIAEMSGRLARREVVLDCSGVAALGDAQLEFLLAEIPPSWDVAELGEVIDAPTLSPALADQLLAWADRRNGRAEEDDEQGIGDRVSGIETAGMHEAFETAPAIHEPPAPYTLSPIPDTLAPAPYPAAKLRADLEDLVVRQLLGPWGGPEEVVDEATVRGRYLVGMLAPRGSSGIPEAYDDGDLGGSDGEDGAAEGPPPKASTTILPSSIGLTFSVDDEAAALQVRVRWGRYERVEIKDDRYRKADGGYRNVWRRTQIDAVIPVLRLRAGKVGAIAPAPACPDVTVQGTIRKRLGEWIVTLFLVNGQAEPPTRKDSAWVFQPELIVAAPDGAPIFRRRPLSGDQKDPEEQQLAMLYRNQVEFAVGHGVAVVAAPASDGDGRRISDRASMVRTTVVPAHEVPQTTPPEPSDPGYERLADLSIDMAALAHVPDGQFHAHLGALADAYVDWIERQERRIADPSPDLHRHLPAAVAAIAGCRQALARIRAGIALLDSDPQAAAAFRFANRAMALQRTRTAYAQAVRQGKKVVPADFDTPKDHSWRTFQLGFILLNLPSLTDPRHPERATPADGADPALADLLWFPTGGGKTEAYLGLTAFTLAIRRLQGVVGAYDGRAGVAVLMRYTLRLLTLQQFQRAAALLCACEVIRREDEGRWGAEPFRIGLWVGQRSTPNWVADAEEAIKQFKKGASPGGGSPYQLKHCPWCGTTIEPGQHLVAEAPEQGRSRVLTYCGSLLNSCPFNMRQSEGEGLPVMVVDEEIYHRLPAVLIATVDKFAQMPWNGRVAALFGRVSARCERHGYLTPDTDHPSRSHPAIRGGRHGPAQVHDSGPLRPPDLIIQDELHLISGPLGTLVGLYETAVDQLASWELDGVRVRPKVVASTATIRRAAQQVQSLFQRDVAIFPPQGLDAGDTFFALQRPPSDTAPGRRYLGICAPGIRHKTALIQTYVSFLAAAQQIYEAALRSADPYMTLVGYFNALRELAAMRRAVDDTVSTRLKKMNRRGLTRRFLDPWSVQELTSRLSAADIPETLDRLETPFDPALKQEKGAKRKTSQRPIDVLLATNMISVGVDVGRLGLMVVGGQPKSTAEYIQATSRVGRQHPGLVVTVYNWARPRDLSHYERFGHYHATFYQYVEALSVTPFSPRAIDRGLSGVLVALARLGERAYNPNLGAGEMLGGSLVVQDAVAQIVGRAGRAADPAQTALIQQALDERLAYWGSRISGTVSAKLGYRKQEDGTTVGLLTVPGDGDWSLFACLNSLRDVEPAVNLVLDDMGLDGDERGWQYSAPATAAAASVTEEMEEEEPDAAA